MAMLAGLGFHLNSNQAAVAEDRDHRLVADSRPIHGGLGGVISLDENNGGGRLTEGDRERMRRGIDAYVAEFGPLSRSDDHAGFAGGAPPLLTFYPFGGRMGEDFNLQQYFDHDLEDGSVLDWNCGNYTQDGIIATHGLVMTFDRQLIGTPVFAALDGVVVTTHDGEDDQNDGASGQDTNFVRLDHGHGLQTSCFSLRKDSVLVSPGDEVRAGQQIGEAASSGNSDWPNLGFAILRDEELVDSFTGSCSPGEGAWINQPQIPDINDTTFNDFGVTVENLDAYFAFPENYSWQPPTEGYVPLDHDAVWMWARGFNLPGNSIYLCRFYDPEGELRYDSGWDWLNFGFESYRFFHAWFYWDIPEMKEMPGTWTVEFFVNTNDQPFLTFPIDVVAKDEPTPNRAPNAIEALITPWNATVDDVLTCRVSSSAPLDDRDWDLVRYRYIWSVGGRVLRDTVSAGLADHLPASFACAGGMVECQVIPSDGMVDGPSDIATVVIQGDNDGDADCDGEMDCPGDFNQDGIRDGGDLGIMLAFWGYPLGDLNGDGNTDGADLGLFLGYWGDC